MTMMLKIFKTTTLPTLVSSVEISKSADKMSDKYETELYNLSGGTNFVQISFFEMTKIVFGMSMISWPGDA